METLIDSFDRNSVQKFYHSRKDNRTAHLQIQNKRRNGFEDVNFVFENVHKLC